MLLRYMGTKRHLAPRVREEILGTGHGGRVADLFSGVGAVVTALADARPTIANDMFAFTGCLARARFTSNARIEPNVVVMQLLPHYRSQLARLLGERRKLIAAETRALEEPSWRSLDVHMRSAPHVGSSGQLASAAMDAASASGPSHYQLCSLYFGSSYFSVRQAAQIDAIRFAIDTCDGLPRDWLLATWISAFGTAMNAPGHAAQPLRCTGDEARIRIARAWRRDIWGLFMDRLSLVERLGSGKWRARNAVTNLEARDLLRSRYLFDTVYADPPYTKDQYSRYYHLYETLYLYDYPESAGFGRYRSDRFISDFSVKSRVGGAFAEMFRLTSEREASLVLSYPENGLLHQAGAQVQDLANNYFRVVKKTVIQMDHSTLGARSGKSTKPALESIYVCK